MTCQSVGTWSTAAVRLKHVLTDRVSSMGWQLITCQVVNWLSNFMRQSRQACRNCLGGQFVSWLQTGRGRWSVYMMMVSNCAVFLADHGVCIMGSCSCQTGWAGPDCSQEIGSGSNSDAWWQSFWWLGVIGFMCAFTGLFATFWMIQRAEWGEACCANTTMCTA